jgi:hypothetical protein
MLQPISPEPRQEEGFSPLALDRYLESARRILTYRQILNLFELIFPDEFVKIPKKVPLSQLSSDVLTSEERAFFTVFREKLSDLDDLDELFEGFIDEIEAEIGSFSKMSIPWLSFGYCLSEIE